MLGKRISDIRGKKWTVLGAARSGVAVAGLLKRHGADVFLSEMAPREEKRDEAGILERNGIASEFGDHSKRILDASGVVVSPGIALSNSVMQMIEDAGIPVWSEIEVASWFCDAPMIAVTGSNGKSTTTALMGYMFSSAGRPCVVAGNIGQPFSDYVERIEPEGVAVLEISSFQLETIDAFHPSIAVFLNLTPDHLDRHGTMEAYGRLKARIFENQVASDYLVYNGLDEKVVEWAKSARSERVVFGVEADSLKCGYVHQGMLTMQLGQKPEAICSVDSMSLRGDHNVSNALAAALAARLMGTAGNAIAQALQTYRALPHRMEFVRTVDGVDWVNDSKATNVDAVWYALGSFSTPVILIAGGRDKDADFRLLRERVGERARSVVLLGEAADKLKEALQGVCPLIRVNTLEEAVQKAKEVAQPHDVVLLSPACASFDMFKNFEDRGDKFKALVERL